MGSCNKHCLLTPKHLDPKTAAVGAAAVDLMMSRLYHAILMYSTTRMLVCMHVNLMKASMHVYASALCWSLVGPTCL